jgi:hypothetical protein
MNGLRGLDELTLPPEMPAAGELAHPSRTTLRY